MRTITAVALLAVAVLGACGPPALTQEEIVPAFIDASQDAARTMRMDWQGTMAIVQTDAPAIDPFMGDQAISATFDFNGPDFAGTMVTGLGGSSNSVSYAQVGGIDFINYSDSGWQRGDSFGGASVVPEMDPFHGMTAVDVAYEGPDTFNGHDVHRLRVLDPLASLNGGLFGGLGGEISPELIENGVSEFLIYVDANAIPVGAHVALDMSMSFVSPEVGDGTEVIYQIRFDYTFSLWGEPVTISPPQLTGGGFEDFAPPGGPR